MLQAMGVIEDLDVMIEPEEYRAMRWTLTALHAEAGAVVERYREALNLRRQLAAMIKDIREDYSFGDIKLRLKQLPLMIHSQRRAVSKAEAAVREAHQAVELAEMAVKEVEAVLILTIAEERGPDGKLRFSNAESRAAELVRSKAHDEEYLEATKRLEEARARETTAQQAASEATAELKKLLDEFLAYQKLAEMAAAELRALGGP